MPHQFWKLGSTTTMWSSSGFEGGRRRRRSGVVGTCRLAMVVAILGMAASHALAEGSDSATASSDLAKKSQNPVGAMISVPFENNATFNNGADDHYVNVINVKPVFPMGLPGDFNLINRLIVPLVYQQGAFDGATYVGGSNVPGGTTDYIIAGEEVGGQFGIGDIAYQGFVTPKKPGKIIWGIGPQLNIPTGTGRMSTDHWAMGPTAVLLAMPGRFVFGALVSNVWSIGDGYGSPSDVNTFTLQ